MQTAQLDSSTPTTFAFRSKPVPLELDGATTTSDDHGARRNAFLATLPPEILESLFKHLELIDLMRGQVLFEHGRAVEHVYFPTTAVISLQYVMRNGSTMEISVVGQEGSVGVWLTNGERAPCSAVVQSAGCAYRLKARHLREAVARGGVLTSLLMSHISALFAQITQYAVGASYGSIEQRLCRWLLDRLDRTSSVKLSVTQEQIAMMLGSRRESVTQAAGKLQQEGLISYCRGKIEVLDRQGLERRAGECYQLCKAVNGKREMSNNGALLTMGSRYPTRQVIAEISTTRYPSRIPKNPLLLLSPVVAEPSRY